MGVKDIIGGLSDQELNAIVQDLLSLYSDGQLGECSYRVLARRLSAEIGMDMHNAYNVTESGVMSEAASRWSKIVTGGSKSAVAGQGSTGD